MPVRQPKEEQTFKINGGHKPLFDLFTLIGIIGCFFSFKTVFVL